MECREASEQLAAYVDYPAGPLSVPSARALEAHLLTCANCRRQLIAYQELSEGLSALATRTTEPPAWLAAALLETARREARHQARRSGLAPRFVPDRLATRQAAALGGAVLLAGLAGALMVGRQRRRQRRRLAGSALQLA